MRHRKKHILCACGCKPFRLSNTKGSKIINTSCSNYRTQVLSPVIVTSIVIVITGSEKTNNMNNVTTKVFDSYATH